MADDQNFPKGIEGIFQGYILGSSLNFFSHDEPAQEDPLPSLYSGAISQDNSNRAYHNVPGEWENPFLTGPYATNLVLELCKSIANKQYHSERND